MGDRNSIRGKILGLLGRRRLGGRRAVGCISEDNWFGLSSLFLRSLIGISLCMVSKRSGSENSAQRSQQGIVKESLDRFWCKKY